MPKKFQTKPETEPVYEAEYPVEYEPDDAAVSERLGTHAQLGYPPFPEGLICEEGHHDGGDAGTQGRCRVAGAAVVNRSLDPLEYPLVGNILHPENRLR